MIELILLSGRSTELKRTVIGTITRALEDQLGRSSTDVLILLNEPPLDNWGCYGKKASELGMDYRRCE